MHHIYKNGTTLYTYNCYFGLSALLQEIAENLILENICHGYSTDEQWQRILK